MVRVDISLVITVTRIKHLQKIYYSTFSGHLSVTRNLRQIVYEFPERIYSLLSL